MEQDLIQRLEEAYSQPSAQIDFKVSKRGVEIRAKGVNSDQVYDLANLAGYQYKQQSEARQYLAALKKQKEFQLHLIALVFFSIVSMMAWVTLWRGLSTAYHSFIQDAETIQVER